MAMGMNEIMQASDLFAPKNNQEQTLSNDG
jgi:hypothetical protein